MRSTFFVGPRRRDQDQQSWSFTASGAKLDADALLAAAKAGSAAVIEQNAGFGPA